MILVKAILGHRRRRRVVAAASPGVTVGPSPSTSGRRRRTASAKKSGERHLVAVSRWTRGSTCTTATFSHGTNTPLQPCRGSRCAVTDRRPRGAARARSGDGDACPFRSNQSIPFHSFSLSADRGPVAYWTLVMSSVMGCGGIGGVRPGGDPPAPTAPVRLDMRPAARAFGLMAARGQPDSVTRATRPYAPHHHPAAGLKSPAPMSAVTAAPDAPGPLQFGDSMFPGRRVRVSRAGSGRRCKGRGPRPATLESVRAPVAQAASGDGVAVSARTARRRIRRPRLPTHRPDVSTTASSPTRRGR